MRLTNLLRQPSLDSIIQIASLLTVSYLGQVYKGGIQIHILFDTFLPELLNSKNHVMVLQSGQKAHCASGRFFSEMLVKRVLQNDMHQNLPCIG